MKTTKTNDYLLTFSCCFFNKSFMLTDNFAGEYKLEVISETDGYKDYFRLNIPVSATQDQLISLSPNPATNTVTAEYQIGQNATNASLIIIPLFGNFQNIYPIDLTNQKTSIEMNLIGYPTGYYSVILMVNGQAVHAKQLIIN